MQGAEASGVGSLWGDRYWCTISSLGRPGSTNSSLSLEAEENKSLAEQAEPYSSRRPRNKSHLETECDILSSTGSEKHHCQWAQTQLTESQFQLTLKHSLDE